MDRVNRIFTVFLIIVVILLFWLVATQNPQNPLFQNSGKKNKSGLGTSAHSTTCTLNERLSFWV